MRIRYPSPNEMKVTETEFVGGAVGILLSGAIIQGVIVKSHNLPSLYMALTFMLIMLLTINRTSLFLNKDNNTWTLRRRYFYGVRKDSGILSEINSIYCLFGEIQKKKGIKRIWYAHSTYSKSINTIIIVNKDGQINTFFKPFLPILDITHPMRYESAAKNISKFLNVEYHYANDSSPVNQDLK